MGEGIQQDAGTVGPVATVRGAELGVGGDEHARRPRVYGDSGGMLHLVQAAAFAPQDE